MTNLTEIIPAADYAKAHAEAKKQSRNEKLHRDFAHACRVRRLPEPHWKHGELGELRFARDHKEIRRLKPKKTDRAPAWAFDFAWPEFKVAVEIQGLVMQEATFKNGQSRWVCTGGHATPDGIKNDYEKINAAQELGWIVLQFEQDMLKAGMAVDTTLRVLFARGWRPGVTPMESNNRAPLATTRYTIDLEVHPEPGDELTKSAPTPSAAPRQSPPAAGAASAEGVSLPVSGTNGAAAAPVLSPAVQEIADTYPKGTWDEDLAWQRATAHIHALIKGGATVAQLVTMATQYRRQQAAMRRIGTPNVLGPDEFFGSGACHGPFDIPEDPQVARAERETKMDFETWKNSEFKQ